MYTHPQEYCLAINEWNAIRDSIGRTWGYFAKWNKSGKDRYCMILLTYEIARNKNKARENSETQRRAWWLPYGRQVGGWVKWVKRSERYKLLVMKYLGYRDVVYSIGTVVNNIVFANLKVALKSKSKCSHHQGKILYFIILDGAVICSAYKCVESLHYTCKPQCHMQLYISWKNIPL